MKKIISLCAAFALTMGIGAAAYTDVKTDDWFYDAVEAATQNNWFSGYDDGSFKPQNTILRSEAAKVVASYKYKDNLPDASCCYFNDVTTDDWFVEYVITCDDEGLISADSDRNFRPLVPITRQDAALAVMGMIGYAQDGADLSVLNAFSDNGEISDYAAKALASAVEAGIVSGFDDNTIKPQDTITRAQFAQIMKKADELATPVPSQPTEKPTALATAEPIQALATAEPAPTPSPGTENKNLFSGNTQNNKTIKKDEKGQWITASNNGFYLSEMYEVTPLQSYYLAMYDPSKGEYVNACKQYAFYGADQKLISAGNIPDSCMVSAPEKAKYIRFSIQKMAGFTALRQIYRTVMINTAEAPKKFIPFNEPISHAFDGKKVYFLGDSFASGANSTWVNGLEQQLFLDSFTLNVGDKYTYTTPSSASYSKTINTQTVIDAIPKDTDYLIVACGMYDWRYPTWTGMCEGLGDMSEVNERMVYGAIKAFANRVKAALPDTEVIMITPPNFAYAGENFVEKGFVNASMFSVKDVSDAISEVAKNNGFKVIDLNSSCWGRTDIEQYVIYKNYSYMTMNAEGNKMVFQKVLEELISK